MNFSIRKAISADCQAIFELIQELADFENAPNEVLISPEELKSHGFGEHPMFEAWVAESESEILGMALIFPKYSTWKGPVLHLEDLVVKLDHRGKGIGKALLTHVIRTAKERGAQRLEWQVLDWNEPAIKFYEKMGASILKEWWNCRMDQKALEFFSPNA